jgi:uncharacterized membrane protein YhaH (DUF805 family)
MSFGESIRSVYGNYFNFSGRASRSEFWWFLLFVVLMYVALVAAVIALPAGLAVTVILGFEALALLTVIPLWALAVRRLHDADRSGWWLLAYFIPVVGALLMLGFWCAGSSQHSNQWGAPAGQPSTVYYYPPASGFAPGTYADTSHPLNFPPPPASGVVDDRS